MFLSHWTEKWKKPKLQGKRDKLDLGLEVRRNLSSWASGTEKEVPKPFLNLTFPKPSSVSAQQVDKAIKLKSRKFLSRVVF